MSNQPSLPDLLRTAMRHWASSVAIVTTRLDEEKHGMTVNSFISVSLEPPLVLISLARHSRTRAMVQSSGVYAVNILRADQEALSNRFAGQIAENEDRFAGLETATLVTGAPLIPGSLAWIDCRLEQQVEAGSHTLFIGAVQAVRLFAAGAPLLYHNQKYRKLAE